MTSSPPKNPTIVPRTERLGLSAELVGPAEAELLFFAITTAATTTAATTSADAESSMIPPATEPMTMPAIDPPLSPAAPPPNNRATDGAPWPLSGAC